MSDIRDAFSGRKAIVAYVVAGDPDPVSTVGYVLALERAGADMVQIGIPFSDPIADEPSQKDAALRGMASGSNIDTAFDVIRDVRASSRAPLSIVSYANPIYRYGYKRFFGMCKDLSVTSVFIIDLPLEERSELLPFSNENGVALVTSVYPSSEGRLVTLAKNSDGYIYMVPMDEDAEGVDKIISLLREHTDTPILMAFGDRRPEEVTSVIGSADGIVIGSGVVEIIGRQDVDREQEISRYISEIRSRI